MATLYPFALPGILLVLTLAFGFWVSRVGKPYNRLLFSVHKLIALGAVVAGGLQLSRMLGVAGSQALIIALLGVTTLSVLALFASGALLSAGKLDYRLMRTLHRTAPVVLVAALSRLAATR